MRKKRIFIGLVIALFTTALQSNSAFASPFVNGTSFYPGQTLTLTGTGILSATSVSLQGTKMFPFYYQSFSITSFTINSDSSITVLIPPASAFATAPSGVPWQFIVRDNAGNYSGTVSTLVSVPAPSFSLTASSETATVGTAIAGYLISSTGGPVYSYSISPDISVTPSNGLSFDTTTGLISGSPTAVASTVTYTITGTNATGSTTVTYRIGVVSAPVVAAPVPDPLQQSTITSITPTTGVANAPTTITASGNFIEKISAIQINGVGIETVSWVQTPTSITFTIPVKVAGKYSIQIYNGSAPVLAEQTLTISAAPTPASLQKSPKQKVTYIRCAKPGHGTKITYGVNPVCPSGYVKK